MNVAPDSAPSGRVAAPRNIARAARAVAEAVNVVTAANPRWALMKAPLSDANRAPHCANARSSALATLSLATPSTSCIAKPNDSCEACVIAATCRTCARVRRKIPAAARPSTIRLNEAKRGLSQNASPRLNSPTGTASTLTATIVVASCWIWSMAMTRFASAPAAYRRKKGSGRSSTRSQIAVCSPDVTSALTRAMDSCWTIVRPNDPTASTTSRPVSHASMLSSRSGTTVEKIALVTSGVTMEIAPTAIASSPIRMRSPRAARPAKPSTSRPETSLDGSGR
jgi:hypothetical protein